MNMKFTYYILFLVLFNSVLSAQENYRFTYELNYAIDSLDRNNRKVEFFLLDIQKEKSTFRSLNGFKRDSLFTIMNQQFSNGTLSRIDLRGYPNTTFPYTIIKTMDKTDVYQRINKSNFYYEENKFTDWKLVDYPEKFSFDNVECKTAKMYFSGREYIAWYREDIPIHDGPYVFSGLPGLIVKIQDAKKDYIFELKEIRKMQISENPPINTENAKKIDKYKFYNAIKSEKENTINNVKAFGIEISPQKEKEFRDGQRKQNNPLELKP